MSVVAFIVYISTDAVICVFCSFFAYDFYYCSVLLYCNFTVLDAQLVVAILPSFNNLT